MSDITDTIKRFQSGEITREALIEDLATREYAVPSYKRDVPRDQYEQLVRIEAMNPFEEGTFGEVDHAYNRGLLPRDVYMDVLRAIQKRKGRRSPPSVFP